MNALICFALFAVVQAVPRLNQPVEGIPNIPIPYEMLRQALQEKENNFNTIQVKDIKELRGGPDDNAEETDLDRAAFEELTPDDIQTAIRIAAALEYVILRDVSPEHPEVNDDSVTSEVKVVHNFEEPQSDIDSEEIQSKDLILKNIANDQTALKFVNMAINKEKESPRFQQMRSFN